jgi:catechol 2,3-dioxygenase-like lactoylglutathione lyase family enzyme
LLRSSFGKIGTLPAKDVERPAQNSNFRQVFGSADLQNGPVQYEQEITFMLNHVSIGVRDTARAKRFYDAALKPLGYKCLSEAPDSLGYGRDAVALWISTSEHPVPADEKSGLHFCFDAPTRKSVAAFHAAGVKAGGRDNGKPGLREDYGANYYAAFVIDPDGYRLEAYCGEKA